MPLSADPNPRLNRREFLGLAGATGTGLILAGCGGSGGSGGPVGRSVSYQWNQTLLDAISATRLGPPMTARAIGIVHTAIYDAWAGYEPVAIGTRLGGQLRRPVGEHTVANKQKALSYAAYRVLLDLYPSEKARFDAKMAELGYDPADTSTDTTTPQGVGNRAAQALLEFRHNDGSNQLNNYVDTTGYVPANTPDTVVDPTQWQPLRFANGQAPGYIGPHWGNVIPFALTAPSAVRPTSPPAFGSPTYLAQAQDVVDLTADLNETRKVIAEYWADGPRTVLPPGHWQIFGQFVSDRDRHTLDDDVKMFFMLGNAVMDAGIACWDCKRYFNSSRPVTAIRAIYAGRQIPGYAGPGQGIQMMDGAQWSPYQSPNFVTPPFPEYTSGHSTFSAAAAEVLKRFTGSDQFGHSVTLAPGSLTFEQNLPAQPVTLSWPTFSDAADQAGISRRYGGIHFEPGDIEARRCGRLVGEQVWSKAMSYINATAPSRNG
jgi:hypothetical protein